MILRNFAACVLFGAGIVSCASLAPEEISALSAPQKLPGKVVPKHYAIELTPELDTLSVSGSEIIDIEVREETSRIVLNALELSLAGAELEGEPGQIATIALDAAAQTATLIFPRVLAQGVHRLRIRFAGRINPFGRGLFVIDYLSGKERKRMLATQLEPADARRIFPCWDEPAFKARFELSVILPRTFTAVSNMPVAREQAAGASTKRVAFAPTPPMSSYLFVLAAGELERETRDFDGVTVGVVTTAGKRAQGRYALESAVALLAYYEDYFGVRYPLPKLDLIALPGGISGAMENWGGITFSEGNLLFDPRTTPPATRRTIFGVLAHEMAHLWFGDLVTMAWWDDLWLNEGFATWMQAKAAERLHPDWQPWLNGSGTKQFAMRQDARRGAHPIRQAVADESEALVAFDGITYSKGQAFIRMLEQYLGEDVFRDGLRAYVREHAYGNVSSADLWRSLAAASAEPVESIAAAFTTQAGVPLVRVSSQCIAGAQRLHLEQGRYTLHDSGAAPQRWRIPLVYGSSDESAPGARLLLDGSADLSAGRCGDPIHLNRGDVGYYRVDYDDASWQALARAFDAMAKPDRVNLLSDAWALAEAGALAGAGAPAGRYFDLVERLSPQSSRADWQQAMRVFGQIDFLQRGRAERQAFQAYARAKLRPVFDRIGWAARPGESEDAAILRPELARALAELGDPDIVAQARRRFAILLKRPQSVSPSLRRTIAAIVGRVADQAEYDQLLSVARSSANIDQRSRYYLALAGALDPALARQTLALALTQEVPTSLVSGLIVRVASGGEQPALAWEFLREHLDELAARLGPNFRRNFAPGLMTNFTEPRRAAELAAFAPAQETSGARIESARAQETILTNAELRERLLPAVDAWVRSRIPTSAGG